jgi:uncharacterized protein
MKVLLTGATGFVGAHLARRLEEGGHEVIAVSRRPGAACDWSEAGLARGVGAADAIVHLAGENLFARRWSAARKQVLWASRVETTQRLARLAAELGTPVLVTASAVGAYGANARDALDETSPRGDGFLADLCRDWEEAADPAVEAGVRTCSVRTGVVLGRGGGALAKMLPPFRLGVGGPLGDGRQWVSWIHLDDLASLFVHLCERDDCRGVYNGTAPHPVTMRELARTLGRVLHRPAVFAVPAPVLRVALGEVADVLLTGQKVLPRRALASGFAFRFPELEPALRDVLAAGRPLASSST